ncbi:2'-5' RNA ligase family protein [Sphingomonas endolithica]|uniref:2'-5' RNA ligase family protein n=1 Tax=Sphingomonas endolithica TaxID=2972485 RepID=UPI0021AEB307|nr:2'-5' RNA ligase family protein [Sphingomonas sp. ZFBP2030]
MPSEPFHRLFFAVRPSAEVVPQIARLRDHFGQARNIVADDRLHLTTWLFPDEQDFPADAAASAQAAMQDVPLQRFEIVLDEMVASLSHVVLVPRQISTRYGLLQAQLDKSLRRRGLLPRLGWRFNPHLTLVYGEHEAISSFAPIAWTAEEIVLINSVVGERRHDVIARWSLN